MKYRISRLSIAIGTSLLCVATASPIFASELRTVEKPIDGQYIVVLKAQSASLEGETNRTTRVSHVAKNLAAMHRANLVHSFSHVLRGFVVKADDEALARLLADPRIAYIEEDGHIYASATQPGTVQTGATWGLDRIDQRKPDLNTTYSYNTTAAGVHAYIIDTGVLLAHSQFSGRISNGFDAVTSGGNANDCNGHGTHVAGTFGGTVWGVAKNVTLHPVRVLDCTGNGTSAGVIAGIDWVAANHVKPAVANMSLGGGGNTSLDNAVNNLINSGVTVVVAAGNNGGDACLNSPARVPSAITVGSTNNSDGRSVFTNGSSNWGVCLDIFAPGSSITSSWYTSTTATNIISGTSMASPHVAGAAALYLANNPSATPSQVTAAIVADSTPNKVTNAGSGSPNRLLYSLITLPPKITSFQCPDSANSGNMTYWCDMQYTSAAPASRVWSGASGSVSGGNFNYIYGDCELGEVLNITVTVSNIYGADSRNSGNFVCPASPLD